MDLREFYLQKITPFDYHYRFFEEINSVNKSCDVVEQEDYDFEIFDAEDAIAKFKDLCQPEVKFENKKEIYCFYLVTFYLNYMGYKIKEFPRLLARPPADPMSFTYTEIRNRILSNRGDDDGIVRYAERRIFVSELTFENNKTYIDIGDDIEQKFIEISNRSASFNEMSIDEKLVEIANLIENMLKIDGKFINLNYSSICLEFVTDEMIKSYRKIMHCFRHASEDAITKRKSYSEEQKDFFINYGLTIIKVIHSLVQYKDESRNSTHLQV